MPLPGTYMYLHLIHSSTPSRHAIRVPHLQWVKAELESLATRQQQGIQEVRNDIRAIKEDLRTLLANARPDSSSARIRIPPQLSVWCCSHLCFIKAILDLATHFFRPKSRLHLENQFDPSLP